MFFKVVFYIIGILVLIATLGETNYNASLYEKSDNAIEFIFPRWDWGHPWFYIFMDSNGLVLDAPDDIEYRFFKSKYDNILKEKELTCSQEGTESEKCIAAEDAVEDAKTKLEDADDKLKDLIEEKEEKGEEVRMSHKYEPLKLDV